MKYTDNDSKIQLADQTDLRWISLWSGTRIVAIDSNVLLGHCFAVGHFVLADVCGDNSVLFGIIGDRHDE